MTPTSAWHAPPELLARFAQDPTSLDVATASSVEAHLVACAACRAGVADHADQRVVDLSWAAVADRIDQPRPAVIERLLQRLGVQAATARLVTATPGLRASGVLGLALLSGLAVLASRQADAEGPFLLLAPLVPLVGVALSFASTSDPSGEAGLAAPVFGVGLALRRGAAVLALAFVLLGVAALTVPHLGAAPVAWVLPAAALVSLSLAGCTWVRPEVAVGGLAATWVLGISGAHWLGRFEEPVIELAPFTPVGQALALAALVAASGVLWLRADRFTTLEVLP